MTTRNHAHPVTASSRRHWHDDDAEPGTFEIEVDDKGLFYVCPCGCEATGFLDFAGAGETTRPSWAWDGDRAKPTLSPSIRRLTGCKWHGFLKAGVWEPCSDSGR